jgi:predicted ferric reductase
MDRVKYGVLSVVALVTLLWIQAEPSLLTSDNFFQWRSGLIQYSGILSLILMSTAMVLALRLPIIETWTQGLDKGYRIHKWLGIAAVLLGVFHWLAYHLPKWLISLEVMLKPVRFNGSGPNANLTGWAQWLKQLKPMALESGEWGFYLLLALLVLSLWSAVKYKPFRLTHRLMAVVYLLVAFHSFALLKRAYWGEPIYWLTTSFLAVGSLAALYSLAGLVGRRARYSASVKTLHYCALSQTLDLTLEAEAKWPSHQAGQFAYLCFAGEEPHPFTIASASNGSQLRFLIKELGDFTTGLHQRLNQGDVLQIEGPYGKFAFTADRPQIWIGAGVGIAPFMAGLEWFASQQSHPQTHLFFCCQQAEPSLCDELKQKAQQAGVSLTIIDASNGLLLSAQSIAQQCGDLRQFEFYFCGPAPFSSALKKALKPYRVNVDKVFHAEKFVMR